MSPSEIDREISAARRVAGTRVLEAGEASVVTGVGSDLGLLGLAAHLEGGGVTPSAVADTHAGIDPEDADARADRTIAFSTGTTV